jgi:two-component system NarL family sensor kinase
VDRRDRVARARVVPADRGRNRLQGLHDGLGPALTGVALKAEAARRLVATDAALAATLMAELRTQTTAAINDIRRLVHDLRPPTLDGLGLVAALREQAVALARRADGAPIQVDVDADDPLPQLSAAAEVAAYRIATEALTNVSRHSAASLATVTLQADPTALILTIRDNGTGAADWAAGVGLTSIRERAQELGGACQVGPGPDGGQVLVTIPLGGAG